MHTLLFEDITPSGELARRAQMNFERLHAECYRFDVLKDAVPQAPGDSIGRVILGLTLLWRCLGKKPEFLDDMVHRLPQMLNEKGYISIIPPHNEGIFCEQEIGGHNALLRGLCEYYTFTNDQKVLVYIKSIVDNLIIPSGKEIENYPAIDPNLIIDGEQVALVSIVSGKWRLSTDIGAIFLVLDGITHAYQIVPSEAFRKVIEQYIKRFSEIDLIELNAQTHASLSALRGILRFYEITGSVNPFYIKLVENVFSMYKQHAMTENYANYNWFERPEWTEPCAVVDSYTVAVWLWRYTGNTVYLEDAHLILYNGLLAGQRPNGGFGCDVCVGAKGETSLKPLLELFEATSCCTMRGAEGLARAIEQTVYVSEQDIFFPFYTNITARLTLSDGIVFLKIQSGYPNDGHVKLEITETSSRSELTFRFYIPSWVERDQLEVKIDSVNAPYGINDSVLEIKYRLGEYGFVELNLPFGLRIEKPVTANMEKYVRYMHGPLVLGADNPAPNMTADVKRFVPLGEGKYRETVADVLLHPVNDMTRLNKEEARKFYKQILFELE